jgi:hypothetical protein
VRTLDAVLARSIGAEADATGLTTLSFRLDAVRALLTSAPAHADEGQYEEFYTPPDPLPAGVPGDLIRTEPSRLVLEPSGQLGAFVATGIRIMYRSTDARGNPNAVTGTYFEPDNPWPGNGPRPLIAYAPGIQGQGDQCAPSRMFNQGIHFSSGLDIMFNYEELFVATMVARGFAVVVTDYEGLGTPGVHTYVNRVAEGQSLADAARAAMRLPGTSLDPHGPVAFWGYSQGGGAAASAAELAPSYAPDLDVVGAYAGAPPADLAELFPYADGSALVGVVGYALNGVIAAYPEAEPAIREKLTPRGEPARQDAEPMHWRDDHEIHVSSSAALLQRRYFAVGHGGTVQEPVRSAADWAVQTQGAGAHRQQPVRPAGAVDGGQSARPRLVRQGGRRRVPNQRGAAVPQQARHQSRTADVGRRRARHAVDRRPLQRPADHAQLRAVLTAGPR